MKNRYNQDDQIDRLKGILFPRKDRKNREVEHNPSTEQSISAPTQPLNLGLKTQIQKLRGKICVMLSKDKNHDLEQQETQRAYLNGINKLTQDLKDYTTEIYEVFEEFVEHLPTHLALDRKNYTNHYFLSLLIQNSTWAKIGSIFKRSLGEGFLAIQREAAQIKEDEESEKEMKNERESRLRNRVFGQMGKYFNKWRYNSNLINLQTKNQTFLKEHCINNDRKIIQNINNLPLLVLMLEQLCRSNSDHCQILILDHNTNKLCKFFQDGIDCVNTSLETVTQRSLLSGETSGKNFKRFQFQLKTSLTKLCLVRKEVIFVANLLRHPDYSDIDNNCIYQNSQTKYGVNKNEGVILYPLFDANGSSIGLLRQYFSHSGSKHVPQEIIDKISCLVEQGLALENHSRAISKEKLYLEQNYYLKMIKLIKLLQLNQENDKSLFQTLSKELSHLFDISQLSVYRIEKKQSSKKGLILHTIWGQNSECDFLLSLVDQLTRKDSSHIYLDSRLVITSNRMLFDLKFDRISTERKGIVSQLLPVELFISVMAKIQLIITKKQEEQMIIEEHQQIRIQKQKKSELTVFRRELEGLSIKFISTINQKISPYRQITQYITEIDKLKNKNQPNEKVYTRVEFFIEISNPKLKNSKKMFVLRDDQWISTEAERDIENIIKIQINPSLVIYISCDSGCFIFVDLIQQTLQKFLRQLIENNLTMYNKPLNMPILSCGEESIFNQTELATVQTVAGKRMWQLNQVGKIYDIFKKEVQQFTKQCFQTTSQVEWSRALPNEINIEEWKNILYQFVLNDPSKAEINLYHHNPSLSVRQYLENNILCGKSKQIVEIKSWLTITSGKKKYKTKSIAQDNSILILLPVYFFVDEKMEQIEMQIKVKRYLQQLKDRWINLCSTFLKGVNLINLNIKNSATLTISTILSRTSQKIQRQNFKELKHVSSKRQQKFNNIYTLKANIQNAIKRRKIVYFNKMRRQIFMKTSFSFDSQSQQKLKSLATTLAHFSYKQPFNLIALPYFKENMIKRIVRIVDVKKNIQNTNELHLSFDKIFYCSKLLPNCVLPLNLISHFIHKRLSCYFSTLKQYKSKNSPKNQNRYESYFQPIKTMKQLQLLLGTLTPNYSLYQMIDQTQCYQIYSFQKGHPKIVAIEQVNNIVSPECIYQIGSGSQLIWQYTIQENQDHFAIKDKLNNISKCIEDVIRNIKESTQQSLTNLLIFKNKWVGNLKVNYWKLWKEQSQQIALLQKNRLNDCLYQISVESQTMKQKLKLQEKTLNNNHSMHTELVRKKQQYKQLIRFSDQHVTKIQESYSKLENTRNKYTILYQRSVIKNVMIVWRVNSQKIKVQEIKMKNKVKNGNKIAIKSIVSVMNPKYQKVIRKVLQMLVEFKAYFPKKVELSKIQVNFDNQPDRLITFQTNEIDKQNSSRNSNCSSSPESKQAYKSLNKLKMNKLNTSSRLQDLSAQQMNKYNNGIYKLNPKTLKFLKRMGKLEQ